MRKELTGGSLIFLTLGFVGMSVAFPFQNISAGTTFVAGHIGEDTPWTLAGSPYVITNDVIIDDGSVLTIDPGVEVRFDGYFTLTVNGSLYAMGNDGSLITFTSNKLDPAAGDWNTIEFIGAANASFIMRHSVVEYAAYGLIIESAGKTIVEKSQVTDVSQSGVYVVGESNTLIKGNTIEVDEYGIYAEGEISSGITVTNNCIVSSHKHGIYILGQPPSSKIRNVTISGNTIFSRMDGIHLHARFQSSPPELMAGRIYRVTISNNTFQCGKNGVYIYVNSWYDGYIYQVTISGNIILLDRFGDGIHLRTDSNWSRYVYNVVVYGNKVSNTTNGIHIIAGEHNTKGVQYDAAIVGNRVSDSEKGISVLGVHSEGLVGINSNITANSICHNTLGISYDTHAHNSAHYNHIYRNSQGMTISDVTTVNATYNYWGDETGPYHAALNPTGKGNSVNGNGTDLVFIPFLSTPISSLNEPPTAVLQTDKTRVTTNQPVKFNATASSDDSRIDEYFFDFGDGTNSSWTTSSTIEHNYTRSGIYNASLIVMDDLGFMNDNAAIKTVTVTVFPPEKRWFDETLIWMSVVTMIVVIAGVLIWKKMRSM